MIQISNWNMNCEEDASFNIEVTMTILGISDLLQAQSTSGTYKLFSGNHLLQTKEDCQKYLKPDACLTMKLIQGKGLSTKLNKKVK